MKKLLFTIAMVGLFVTTNVALAKSSENTTRSVSCIKAAITKRENSITGSLTTYMNGLKDAYSKRLTALQSAWEITNTNDRNKAIKTAAQEFKKSISQSSILWRKAKQSAWATFYQERKACKVSGADADSINHVTDFED